MKLNIRGTVVLTLALSWATWCGCRSIATHGGIGQPVPGTGTACCGGTYVASVTFKNTRTGGYTFTPIPGQERYAAICLCDPTACVVASPTDGSASTCGTGGVNLKPPKAGYRFKAFFYKTPPANCTLDTPGFQ
jgi:hypothetical protein